MKSYSVILYRLLVVAMGLVAGGWSFEASAQAVIKNVELDAMDISAATSPRLDLNDEPCALIKVSVLADNVDFSGNIVGDVTRHGAVYWVYVTSGTKRLRMSAPSFNEMELRFANWNIIEGVKGKCVYKVGIDLPLASTSAPTKVKRGYVTFHLDPPTAYVKFNGQLLNNSSGTAYKLMPYGNYSYEVSAPGYATFSGTVAVNSEKIEVPVKLQSTKASVEVTAVTPGCQIYVDGTPIGTAPIVRELMPGDYVLEARRDGYRPREISVSLQASTRMPVKFPELEMIMGELSVEYEPVGSEIRLDGALVGTTPAYLPSVPAGSHKLDISHDGYQTANLTVNISETASTPITGTLTPVSQAGEEENWTPFEENGKYGFKDANGNTVIPFEYDFIYSFSEGLAVVKRGDKYGYIDKNNNIVIPFEYEYTDDFSEGLAGVRKGEKFGHIDKNGMTVIPFEYDDISYFSEGLARVKKDGKYGSIDKNNNTVIPFEYDLVGNFSEGLAAVERDGKWGFIDKNDKTTIPFEYDFAGSFSEGLAPVKKDGKWGFINKNNNTIIPFEYDFAFSFSEGLASVEKNGKYGFIDKTGKSVIPFEYNDAYAFNKGKARVRKSGSGWFYINKKGERIR